MGIRKKFAGGKGSITAHGKRELVLWAENTESLLRQMEAFGTNFARKMKNGKFNRSLALKGIANNVVPRIQRDYKKHMGAEGLRDFGIPYRMSAVDKRKVASALLSSILEDARDKLAEMRKKKKGRLI